MNKENFYNTFRTQCLDVEQLSMDQFDRSLESVKTFIPYEKLLNVKRIIATGCGDSYLAACEMKEAFNYYLPNILYETPSAIDAARYVDLDTKNTMVIAVSVSGGASRISEILQRAKHNNCLAVALTDNLSSKAASSADYVLHTNTPKGDNYAGLRSYYASMITLIVFAAYLAEQISNKSYLSELKKEVESYKNKIYANINNTDDTCFNMALQSKEYRMFEVVADYDMFVCGKFISAKFAELSGDVCSVIDSENYFHVNSLMYPEKNMSGILIIDSNKQNLDRIVESANDQIKSKRKVIIFSDKNLKQLGIENGAMYCYLPFVDGKLSFINPLFCYIPISIFVSYHATMLGEEYFRGGMYRNSMTLGNNPIRII